MEDCFLYPPYVIQFLGDMNKCLLTSDMEPATDQSNDTIKFQLGEPLSLLLTNGILGEVWVRDYLQKHR